MCISISVKIKYYIRSKNTIINKLTMSSEQAKTQEENSVDAGQVPPEAQQPTATGEE